MQTLCHFQRYSLIVMMFVILPVTAAAEVSESEYNGDCDAECVGHLADIVRALRVENEISLDGVLDEAIWQRPTAAPLVQNDPYNGCAPTHRTDWWVAYDDVALYVGARMYDSAPDSIGARLGRRDTWPVSDWVYINLDTFNDDRNAFSFSVNPLGVLGDSALYNDGWGDNSWDGVWEAATEIDELGWTAEIRIPFSQLSFPDVDQQTWGINFSRRIARNRERDEIFYTPRGGSGYGRRFPDLVGIEGIRPETSLEIMPYASSKGEFLEVDPDDPFRSDSDFGSNFGVDLKYGLSSDLNLTATINPDFGQVEVDPAVINLSANETYYSERRPFFVEDANIFRFGREGTNNNWNFNWNDPNPFYSRRVGRAPQLGLDDHDYADCPNATTILGAAKITGKIGGYSVGMLSSVTAREKATLSLDGAQSDQVVEPMTTYSIVRAKRASTDGRRGLGFLATNVTRDLDDPISQTSLDRRAWTGGVDGWITLDDEGVWALKGYLSGSHITGSKESIDSLQRSSRRYCHRPQADHMDYDPEATSLSGLAGRLMLNKQSGNWRLNSAAGLITPGYDVNDIGFHSRSDLVNVHCQGGYHWLEPKGIFRQRYLDVGGYRSWDFGGTATSGGGNAFWNVVFKNYWAVGGYAFFNPKTTSTTRTRGGPNMEKQQLRDFTIWADTNSRKPVYFETNLNVWDQGADCWGGSSRASVILKPRHNLELTFGPRYSWSQGLQYVDRIEDATMDATFGSRYVFSDLDYREFSLATRINWTMSPKFSIQTYFQPLIASGRYTKLREFAMPDSYEFNEYGVENGSTISLDEDGNFVIDPDGAGEAESFSVGNPDFNYKSFKANVVMRWEYRPGSAFFLVWTQDRVNFDDPGDFDIGRDAKSLFSAPGEDIFMAKFTYWFDM